MKNGYLHNYICHMVELALRQAGGRVCREYTVDVCGRRGVIDLYAEFRFGTIACEVELSSRRVHWDMEKARASGANALLILTPSRRVTDACQKKLELKRDQEGFESLWSSVSALGAFPEWLANYLSFFSGSFDVSKSIPARKQNLNQ